MHNLAQYGDSPPSSTSHRSAASSSLAAPTCSAPLTSVTANDCFNGSALFDSTASTGLDAAARHATDANGSQQPSDSAQGQREPSNQRSDKGKVLDSTEAPDQATSGQALDRSSSNSPQELQPQQQQQLPRRNLSPNVRRQVQRSGGFLQPKDASHMRQWPHSQHTDAGQAKPRPVSIVATKQSHNSESSEDLMSLEELEGRIASLNKTLLRAPTDLQASLRSQYQAESATFREQSPSHQHSRHAASEQQNLIPQRQHQDFRPLASVQADQTQLSKSRGAHSSKLSHAAHQTYSSSKEHTAKPTQTAWQKLTAQHQTLQGPNCLSHQHAAEEEEAVCSPAQSPPEPRVSLQYEEHAYCFAQSKDSKCASHRERASLCNSRQQSLQSFCVYVVYEIASLPGLSL